MKTEKFIISFVAILVGIVVAAGAFFIYQQTKTVPLSETKVISINPVTVTPAPSIFLAVDRPGDEEVTDKKTITVSGKTAADAVVLISTNTSDQIINPAQNGNFSVTQSIEDGVNIIVVTAIAPNGQEAKVIRTITYSTESF